MAPKTKPAYDRLRFHVAARFGPLVGFFYRHFHRPRPGSLGDLLSEFSRATPSPLGVVQIGANDGIKGDPLHKFIRRDGWQGVLLEPQRTVFERWLRPLHALNPLIETVNAALGAEDGRTFLFKIGFSDARWATGLASFQRDQLERVLEGDHVRREAAREGVEIPSDPDKRIRAEEVEVVSPDSLLARVRLPRFDLLFIDTEGFDFEVVKLFDVARTRPRLIVFENDHLSEPEKLACEDHLRRAGYRPGRIGPNSFALRDDVEGFARFYSPA